MKLEKLSKSLELLMNEKEILPTNEMYNFSEYDELTNIIIEILDTVYRMVNMKKIETKVSHAMKIDVEAIEKGLEIIEEAKPSLIKLCSDGKLIEIVPSKIIHETKEFIEKIKTKNIDRMNALFSLELLYDGNFDRLLMGFNPDNKIFESMQSLLLNKLKNIKDDEILLLWAQIKSHFNNDEQKRGFPLYDDIIPSNFFSFNDSSLTARDKCAILIAKYKPLTIKKMVEEGITSIPLILPGIARILAISDVSKISQISNLEILLIRSASQIIALHNSITQKETADIAKAIGVDQNGLVFDGEFFKEYQSKIKNCNQKKQKNELLSLNVKRLIEYISLFSNQKIAIEEALYQYKWGQEAIHPFRRNDFKNAKKTLEIYLQKDMSKFLLERNIIAFGKTVGRNQIDLYHKDLMGEDFVIEAKVYKVRKITLRNLKKNIVQLQSYMDLHDQPKGILAIYNFTNTLIMAPRKWIKGRILIVCINLCELSPSGRESSLEIVESDSNVIDVIKVGNVNGNYMRQKLTQKKKKHYS